MTVFQFMVGALAVYRLTLLFARDAGPFGVFKKLRKLARFSKFLSCPFCVSVWAGSFVCALFALCGVKDIAAMWFSLSLAMSAIAIILDRTFTSDFQA